jgi:hypothetical protein
MTKIRETSSPQRAAIAENWWFLLFTKNDMTTSRNDQTKRNSSGKSNTKFVFIIVGIV